MLKILKHLPNSRQIIWKDKLLYLRLKYQIEASNTSQTAENQSNDKDKSAILSEYEKLWLNNAELPNDA